MPLKKRGPNVKVADVVWLGFAVAILIIVFVATGCKTGQLNTDKTDREFTIDRFHQ